LDLVGNPVDNAVGLAEGDADGDAVGLDDGDAVGFDDGDADDAVGDAIGATTETSAEAMPTCSRRVGTAAADRAAHGHKHECA
jgi:hypothetical protein